MHTYTVWTGEPAVGSSVITSNLARAHAERDQRVLVVDFTAPGNGPTEYFDIEPADVDAENIVSHLLEEADGAFENLIESAEPGVDIVPTHDHLDGLGETLEQNATLVEMAAPRSDYEYPKTEQLHRVLSDSKVFYEYDMILVYAGSGVSQHAYNAVYAAPNVLIPADSSGIADTESGLEEIETELEDIDISVLGVVPSEGADPETDLPVTDVRLPDYPSLFEDARVANASIFAFDTDEEYRELSDAERSALESFATLAEYVTTELTNY